MITAKELKKYGITEEVLKDPEFWKKIREYQDELKSMMETRVISGTIAEVAKEVFFYQTVEKTLLELWAATIPYQIRYQSQRLAI